MKNLRVKVRDGCNGRYYDFGIFDGKKILMEIPMKTWDRKSAAICNAKAMAIKLGIKYDPEIIKRHGC